MKAIIFNGSLERRTESTSGLISAYISEQLETLGIRTDIFTLADSGIPLFDLTLTQTPLAVERMTQMFPGCGSSFLAGSTLSRKYSWSDEKLPGLVEVTASSYEPYLTDKTIGLVCWADGLQAMQGINAMDTIAKSLRAWPLPFSVPILKASLFEIENPKQISAFYTGKLNRLISIATTRKIEKMIINQSLHDRNGYTD
jgi:arsenic resistance protein ArsH